MGIEYVIIAAIVLLVMIVMSQDSMKAYLTLAVVGLGLFLCIQTIGCDSFSERRQKRQQERRERWQEWRQSDNDEPEDDQKKRFWKRFRNVPTRTMK